MFVVWWKPNVRFPPAVKGATSPTVRPTSASGSCMGTLKLPSGGTCVYGVHVMTFPYMDVLLSFGRTMKGTRVLTSLTPDVCIRGIWTDRQEGRLEMYT